MGTENTITTKPITSDIDISEVKSDIHSGDTRDIDIIKDPDNSTASDFFTNVYEFSKKDFQDANDDDFFDEPKKGGCFKIILLLLLVFILSGVIVYFIIKYGQGIY